MAELGCTTFDGYLHRSYSDCRMSDLRNEIGALSTAEKFDLLDALWESLEEDPPQLTDSQKAELDDRVRRNDQNPSDVIPWDQVRAGLFKKQ